MSNNSKIDIKNPCFLIIGEWEVSKSKALKLAHEILGHDQDKDITILEGEDISSGQIVERLKTKGLFSKKRIVIVRDFKQLEKKEEQEKLEKWCNIEKTNKDLNAILILFFSPESFNKKTLSDLIEKVNFYDFTLKDSEKDTRSFIIEFLKNEGKSIKKKALDLFIDLVGSSSATAIKKELEKLIFLVGDKREITEFHVEELVFRHKTEEIYKISDAIRKKDITHALKSLNLLIEQNIPPVAILSTIRNTIIRILSVKIITAQKPFKKKISFDEFKISFWPKLKEEYKDKAIYDFLKLHPYSAYLMFQAPYKINELFAILENMAFLDLELKGGKVTPQFVLENFLFSILKNSR